jgi:hypothetical protein
VTTALIAALFAALAWAIVASLGAPTAGVAIAAIVFLAGASTGGYGLADVLGGD